MSAMVILQRLATLERQVAEMQEHVAGMRKCIDAYTAPKQTLSLPKKDKCPLPTTS